MKPSRWAREAKEEVNEEEVLAAQGGADSAAAVPEEVSEDSIKLVN